MTPYEFSIQITSPVRQVHSLPVPQPFSQARLERFELGQWTPVTCQIDHTSDPPTLHWLAVAKPHSPWRYRLTDAPPLEAADPPAGFTIEDCHYRFKVRWGQEVAATYNFIGLRETDQAGKIATIVDPKVNIAWVGYKPFWYPLYSPSGLRLTENSPADHPHHHSLWFGHADVNGYDVWSETGKEGRIVLQEIRDIVAGPVFVGWTETNFWLSPDREKLFAEDRTHRLWRVDQGYLLDMRFVFRATEGEVRFGQVKDGGLGLRVADSMDVEDGGVIVNSHGDRNEAGTFDRQADWVDFSGLVAGRVGGLALFNGPDVPPHPWFTRDYGPALSNFMRFEPYTIAAGEQLQLSFRVYLHDGDAAAAEVAEHYLAYRRPPELLPS
jgi:hypothetical protein